MVSSERSVEPARAGAPDWLLRRWAEERRPADLDELARRFRPLARQLALRYSRGADGLEDLEQIACLGLVKALHRYDPDRGFAFTSFAVPTILGEIKRSFRDTAWAVHVPRSLQERVARVRGATETLTTRDGRAPTVAQLAAELACGEEDVLEALGAGGAMTPVALDGALQSDDDEGTTLLERLGADEDGYELVEDRAAIATALPSLTSIQREVLRLRFDAGLKQSDIARQVGVSQMQVSRVLRAALERLAVVANHRSTVPEPVSIT